MGIKIQPDFAKYHIVDDTEHTLTGVKEIWCSKEKEMKKRNLLLIAVVLILSLACQIGGWELAPVADQAPAAEEAAPAAEVEAPSNEACLEAAEAIGAPNDVAHAICDATPEGDGVSLRLPVNTYVEIGTITFDAEYRVWFLQGFTTPSMANYAFEYAGAERALFNAPFVLGTELGWSTNGSRIPFEICWDTTSPGCTPPVDLFPND